MAVSSPGTAVSSTNPRSAYYAWKTVAQQRQSSDITADMDVLLRECWSRAYDLGRRDGVIITSKVRGAVTIFEDFVELLHNWDLERTVIEDLGEEERP